MFKIYFLIKQFQALILTENITIIASGTIWELVDLIDPQQQLLASCVCLSPPSQTGALLILVV